MLSNPNIGLDSKSQIQILASIRKFKSKYLPRFEKILWQEIKNRTCALKAFFICPREKVALIGLFECLFNIARQTVGVVSVSYFTSMLGNWWFQSAEFRCPCRFHTRPSHGEPALQDMDILTSGFQAILGTKKEKSFSYVKEKIREREDTRQRI